MDTTNLAISVRRARRQDAPALAQLVNRAYEVEGFFVDGSRTTADEIATLIGKGTFLVLERSSAEGTPVLAAAVYVDTVDTGDTADTGDTDTADTAGTAGTSTGDTGDTSDIGDTGDTGGYIGMLSVDPTLQGQGLGTRLVRIAEAMCEAMGAASVRLRIVNLREELARWYKGLGYEEVGTYPYDHRPVKQPCHFVEMTKRLVPERRATLPARDVMANALA